MDQLHYYVAGTWFQRRVIAALLRLEAEIGDFPEKKEIVGQLEAMAFGQHCLAARLRQDQSIGRAICRLLSSQKGEAVQAAHLLNWYFN